MDPCYVPSAIRPVPTSAAHGQSIHELSCLRIITRHCKLILPPTTQSPNNKLPSHHWLKQYKSTLERNVLLFFYLSTLDCNQLISVCTVEDAEEELQSLALNKCCSVVMVYVTIE